VTDDLDYHRRELKIALSVDDPRRAMPTIPSSARRVLDIGCGAGQTLMGLGLAPDILAVGIDPDFTALNLGREWSAPGQFVCGSGEQLPFPDQSFDFVMSRVALPYTNVPVALREVARVLAPGGEFWMTLQPVGMVLNQLGDSLRARQPKAVVFQVYALANGLLLHFRGQLLLWPFGRRRYESYQTAGGIRRLLSAVGLSVVGMSRERHFIVTSRKTPPKATG
jgi:SAM-dependent methyltransferase